MKRSLLLLALAVFAVGASSMAQDGDRTGDGQHRVAYAIDPFTGEYLFAETLTRCSSTPETFPTATSAPSGNLIRMNHVAVVPWATAILSTATVFDIDRDTKGELLVRVHHQSLCFELCSAL